LSVLFAMPHLLAMWDARGCPKTFPPGQSQRCFIFL
jgi:hypothetical protein